MGFRSNAVLAFAAACAVQSGAQALVINLTYTSNITGSANSAAIQAACAYAAQQIQSNFTDNITVNITVDSVAGTGTLGQSSSNLSGSYTYAQVRTYLLADSKSSNDATALASDWPATDPTGGGSFWLTRAEAKAVGAIGASSANDGTFTFGAGLTYSFDPNNRAVSGAYDFIGVALHEFTEIMGRIFFLGQTFNGKASYMPHDMFRFTGPGARSITTTGTNVYFSINAGTTLLKKYNSGTSGDLDDWASGTNDAFNAFANFGVLEVMSAVDIQVMDVIGYDVGNCSPVITTQPTVQTVCAGGTGQFSVAATGSSLTYRWSRGNTQLVDAPTPSGAVISGSTTPTLTITGAELGDFGTYSCAVTNGCGTTTSNGVSLYITSPPLITQEPAPQAVCAGGTATFVTAATGSPSPTFQWQFDGGPSLTDGPTSTGAIVSGSGTPTLTITGVQAGDAASYSCVITNTCTTTTTNAATLTLATPATFTGQPSAVRICSGGSAAFSITVADGMPAVTYQWQWSPLHTGVPLNMTEGVNIDPASGLPAFTATGTQTPSLSCTGFNSAFIVGPSMGVFCSIFNPCTFLASNQVFLSICLADFNCSGSVTVQDIFDFLSAWFAKTPASDFNDSGAVSVQDIFDFLSAWFAGCH